ncbi:uncharacterized protein F5147DRAFT_653373 [Suillus discolor]|uniref:Uncharacterized protein n=1 Tax=Suillus discolor TaxID=1912936 RepID=A0A9P7F5E9_9AGAM|nr:uncharacterized protein F5147DRAFT_653373 [Suillus discolor]KAG2107526.1 hypothetical protein F5147DRAFT_653373 [Suillus discolor]
MRSRRIRYGEVCSESNPGKTERDLGRSLTWVSKVETELIGVQAFKGGTYAIPLVLVSAVKCCMVGYLAQTNTTRHQHRRSDERSKWSGSLFWYIACDYLFRKFRYQIQLIAHSCCITLFDALSRMNVAVIVVLGGDHKSCFVSNLLLALVTWILPALWEVLALYLTVQIPFKRLLLLPFPASSSLCISNGHSGRDRCGTSGSFSFGSSFIVTFWDHA